MNHDALSKALFALPQVEADLLRIVAAGWVHLLDLSKLERLSAEHPSANLTQRIGDLVWRAPFREGKLLDGNRPWLLQPTELQSTEDPEMAERLAEYLGRHLRALRQEGILSWGEEPRVLPVVVYDGYRRWRRGVDPAGVPDLLQPGGYMVLDAGAGELEDWPHGNRVTSWVRLVRARDPEELLMRLVEGLREFPEASDEAFQEALYAWALALWDRMVPGSGGLPPRAELEKKQEAQEMTTIYEANAKKWREGVLQEGIAQGMERGIAQGEARARADERARLGRLAGRKFGNRASERLSALIEGVSDPERLAEVGDWIIDCANEDDFLARAERRS